MFLAADKVTLWIARADSLARPLAIGAAHQFVRIILLVV